MSSDAKHELQSTRSRYLVIGSTGYSGADSVRWDSKSIPNIVDYDTVIIDVPSLDEDTLKKVPSRILEDIQKQLIRLLDSKGTLIVITDFRHVDPRPQSYPQSVDNYDWCPISIGISDESGESLTVKQQRFVKYLSHLHTWEYYLFIPRSCLSHELQKFYGSTYDTKYSIPNLPIITNRYDEIIAGVYEIQVRKRRTRQTEWKTYEEYPTEPDVVTGDIVLLPRLPSLDRKDAVRLILEQLTGVLGEAVPPDWVEEVKVPGVLQLDREITDKLDSIARTQTEIRLLHEKRETLNRYKKMLYGSGHELEEIVAASFERLGGKVTPAKYSEEEFVLEFEGKEYLVEVKGVGKSIALTHLRQLNDYLSKYEEDTKSQCKGILFGNAWRDYPLKKRGINDMPEFPDNVIQRAQQWGIALVSSVSFFYAFSEFLEGMTEGATILKRIVESQGCVTLPMAGESSNNEIA